MLPMLPTAAHEISEIPREASVQPERKPSETATSEHCLFIPKGDGTQFVHVDTHIS